MTVRRPTSTTSEELVGWQELIGFGPHKVLIFEHLKRKRVLYLRWRVGGNWEFKSLQMRLYDERDRRLVGRALLEAKEAARAKADEQFQKNKGTFVDAPAAELPPAPLTLLDGLARAIDEKTGKYPVDTPHRREVEREVTWAASILRTADGEATWESITRANLTKLWRTKFEHVKSNGRDGLRTAEKMVARVAAVASWLRDMELIPAHVAVVPSKWKEMLRTDYATIAGGGELPDVQRPRHTVEESRRIMGVAGQVDARLALLLALGAELRPGQVLRRWRSDLTLPPIDWAAVQTMTPSERQAVDYGTFRTRTSGKKGGALIDLTRGQRFAVDEALAGYLRELEAAYVAESIDYPLFPGERLVERDGVYVAPLARRDDPTTHIRTAIRWFNQAESIAEVPHVPGRSFYGLRRRGVDFAADDKISAGALQEFGGWSDINTPLGIYREQASGRDRREARDARARLRGEDL